jgi:mono/diheme cytochrome c family protein
MNIRRLFASMLFVSLSATFAWGQEKVPDDAAPKITFDDHIKPIFRQHCLNCHNQGEAKGGLALDTLQAVITGGGSGEIVYDGDHEGSRLWQLIAHEDTPVMPPGQDKIPQEQIDLVAAWIRGGMLENVGSKAKKKKTSSLAFSGSAGGRPEGPPPMPEQLPQSVPVLSQRAAAIPAVAASPWAPLIAISGQKQVAMYHAETGDLLGILPFPEGIPLGLRFSRDGAYLVVAGGEHSAMGIAAIYNIKTGERVAEVGDELDVAFDADVNEDLSLVALGGPQRMLRIYNTQSGERVFDIKKHTDWIYAVAFSPDGVLIASGDRSAGLIVWEAATGQQYLDLVEHKGAINDIAWRDDSNVFASASDDGNVKLWDVASGAAIKTISAHPGGATGVAFDHQGRLVTSGKDQKVKLWNANGDLIREFPAMQEAVLTVGITHDGLRVVGGDWTGAVIVSESENPEAKFSLAANPPPPAERLTSQLGKLAVVEPEFQASQAQADILAAKLAEASKQHLALVAQRDEKLALAKQAEELMVKAMQHADELKLAIASQSQASRDLYDRVVVARLGDLESAEGQQAAAERELQLAGSLSEIAKMRQDQIAERSLAAVKQQEISQLKSEAEAMGEPIRTAETAQLATKAEVDAFAAQHAVVVAKKQSIERLIAQLRQALEGTPGG